MKENARRLSSIVSDLQAAMLVEKDSIVAIGNLLIEAKEQVKHGEWLPWLEKHFSSSINTAENYMRAAEFTTKFPTVVNLKLRPSALYYLPYCDQPVIEAAFKRAETAWITERIVHQIEAELAPHDPLVETDIEVHADVGVDSAIEELLSAPPPVLPPAPPTANDVGVQSLDQAITTLSVLKSKSLIKFINTTHKHTEIRAAGDFLHDIARQQSDHATKRQHDSERSAESVSQ